MSHWAARLLAGVCAVWALPAWCADSAPEDVFEDVPRIVAVGDVHGDFQQLRRVLLDAGVINNKDRWRGGKTHLVQLGDIPDRGPDTRKALDLLMRLEKQASRAGGRVHALIGNHEAMNIIGDLRYVHPGEYAAFVGRKSAAYQDAYYARSIDYIRQTLSEDEWPVFDDDYRAAWEERFPLGYVEHRNAWSPAGKYGSWVAGHNAIVKINGILFMHGGLSPKYADTPLRELNNAIRAGLAAPPTGMPIPVVDDELGPLWYRGLAVGDHKSPQARAELDHLLAAQQAQRIVIAHTPLTGTIVPRFDARVIAVDVGLSAYYGGRVACLIIEGDRMQALHRGHALTLPASDEQVPEYLRAAAALDPSPSPIESYLQRLLHPASDELSPAGSADPLVTD